MDVNAVIGNFKNVITKHYFDFNGRARRAEFWWYILVVVILNIIVGIIDRLIGMTILGSILSLALLLPNLGIEVRRLHDIEKSGWWVLLPAAPIVVALLCFFMLQWTLAMVMWLVALACFILLIYWFAQAGTSGQNKFGPDPKAGGKKM